MLGGVATIVWHCRTTAQRLEAIRLHEIELGVPQPNPPKTLGQRFLKGSQFNVDWKLKKYEGVKLLKPGARASPNPSSSGASYTDHDSIPLVSERRIHGNGARTDVCKLKLHSPYEQDAPTTPSAVSIDQTIQLCRRR